MSPAGREKQTMSSSNDFEPAEVPHLLLVEHVTRYAPVELLPRGARLHCERGRNPPYAVLPREIKVAPFCPEDKESAFYIVMVLCNGLWYFAWAHRLSSSERLT